MIKKTLPFLLALLTSLNLQAEEAAETIAIPTKAETVDANEEILDNDLQDKAAEQIALISEAFGHIIAKHIDSLGVDFDIAQIVKGLQDAGSGIASPMSEVECIEAITKSREAQFNEMAKTNLDKANAYMQENHKASNISIIEEGKLHYHIDKEGQGAIVEPGCSPIIRYTGKFLDGTIFGASKGEDIVILDETIPGFGKGLLGMKEGEKRTLYIHPDLAYGTMGQLPPNSLLVFEVELVKATTEPVKETASPVAEQTTAEQQTAALDAHKETSVQ